MFEGSEDSDDREWDSGPFCRHWGALGECEELCRCGHTCGQHDGDDCRECDCDAFKDAE